MSFIQKSLFNVFFYSCGLMVVNGLSFLMMPFYTRQFAPQDYAVIVLIFVCLPFTRYTIPMEIPQAAPVFSADDKPKAHEYISIGFWFILMMNMSCYAVIWIINLHYHIWDFTWDQLLVLSFVFLVDSLFYYTSNILRWQLKHLAYNFIISSIAILEVLFTIFFVMVLKLSIWGVFYSWAMNRLLGLCLCYGLTKEMYAFFFDFKILKKMLNFSIPLVLANLAYNVNRSFDRWFIAKWISLSAVGIYGAGATIGGTIGFVMASFSAALTPIVYRDHQREEAPQDIVTLFYTVITICFCIAIFFALFNKEILTILVAKSYYIELANCPFVPVVVLSAILSGINIFTPGIAIKRKTHLVIAINFISMAVNIIAVFLLFRLFNITGVAVATLLSIFTNSLLYVLFSQKYYPLPFRSIPLMSFAVFICLYLIGILLGLNAVTFELDSIVLRTMYCLIFYSIALGYLWRANKSKTILKNIAPLKG